MGFIYKIYNDIKGGSLVNLSFTEFFKKIYKKFFGGKENEAKA